MCDAPRISEASKGKKAANLAAWHRGIAAYKKGEQIGEEIVAAVDDLFSRLVEPWAANMIDLFRKRVGVRIALGDNPREDAQKELKRFHDSVDDHMIIIKSDIQNKLSDYEILSVEWQIEDTYKNLLNSKFGDVRLRLTIDELNIAADVVIARSEEMGFTVDPSITTLAVGQKY